MPPLRNGRASKACDLCRKHKTRCYASDNPREPCLRCKTLSQQCSLGSPYAHTTPISRIDSHDRPRSSITPHNPDRGVSTDERLERLERTVSILVDRLDSKLSELGNTSSHQRTPSRASLSSPEPDAAPVMLIRDAATNAGVTSPEQNLAYSGSAFQHDVISAGLVPLSFAHSLLTLFHLHYGRWVRFPEDATIEILLPRVRKSPLLLCSIFLIAVRHTNQDSARIMAPKLFQEAKRLMTSSLLEVPQAIEFFQAALILSLWSTTVGQVPLSIDSWLLTGYAIQQALASPCFSETLRANPLSPTDVSHIDSWCVWNHICVAHLQYCVGTRRQTVLNQAHIDRCVKLIDSSEVTNYEARMVAEVKLYWIIYNKCGRPRIDLAETKLALQNWQRDCMDLFDEPRSQFLQMGFHFAHLLAHCQWLKSPKSVMHKAVLKEVIHHCQSIIKLAIDTTDERTRHLTDHIYHIITFSALTLCRIVHTYESKLKAAEYDITEIDNLVLQLVNWLRSIGLPCHAARILGDVVSAQFQKLRPDYQPTPRLISSGVLAEESLQGFPQDQSALPPDLSFLYPSFIGSELFDMDIGTDPWPEWGQSQSDTDISI
ncbi:hypothetical protein BKA67DRAFT_581868 [Truncatella angustata]|uniref:Transcriptional activator of proteases prtT n=1 Tax=Truncatella angustata TaxID=152316 RepID=A0A9P8RJF8_9PEZI|nr:uncharacterized protein BKA67DRAFT_581868 [Truncatella angustata]KAH6647169.1 hypothetical protein BKA67DRAFT_581868 [Truncatella angustata]